MLSVNWFWKKCRLARFSERIPLWQSPPQRDGCLVFVTFPTNLHACDKNQVWVNGSMGLGCFGKRERLEEEREREGLLLMSSHERLSPPPPTPPLLPLFWKYESFLPLVLKVWALCSPCFESMRPFFSFFQSISPFFTFLWFNVLKVWALCFQILVTNF